MDLHLNGKVVLITGGTDGLGAALADRLVEEGARVAVCGRDAGRLAATEQRLRDAGGDALVVEADVTRPADLERFVDAAVARWGRVDGLVNNAGKSAAGRIDQVSDDEWIADLNLKVLAAVRCTRLAVPHLIAAGGGSIVNVLNTGAKAPGAGSLPTTASRAAGLAITKAASKDLGGHGIRVNAVLLGLLESGQWRRRAAPVGGRALPADGQERRYPAGPGGPVRRVRRPGGLPPVRPLLLRDRLGRQSRRGNQPGPVTRLSASSSTAKRGSLTKPGDQRSVRENQKHFSERTVGSALTAPAGTWPQVTDDRRRVLRRRTPAPGRSAW
jgi:NAD(P)-dependent dehydrogenase (short-subunit alcohol dehydrogenase family)